MFAGSKEWRPAIRVTQPLPSSGIYCFGGVRVGVGELRSGDDGVEGRWGGSESVSEEGFDLAAKSPAQTQFTAAPEVDRVVAVEERR